MSRLCSRLRDFYAVDGVRQRLLAYRSVRVTKRAELITLILKQIRIDGAGPHAVPGSQLFDNAAALGAIRKIPQHVERNGRANARQRMHLAGIAELLLNCACRRRLNELAEPRARVREPP